MLGRYIQTSSIALALDLLLLVAWRDAGRSAASLGLDIPLSAPDLIGMGSAVRIPALLGFTMPRAFKRATPGAGEAVDSLLPKSSTEFVAFVAFTVVVGCSWELLYRGYLLWGLTPHVGLVGAIAMAATAYGVAHGYKPVRLMPGSLASALVFTVAFAFTKSLWWLMVIHCGLPLIGALVARKNPQTLSASVEDRRAVSLPACAASTSEPSWSNRTRGD